MIATAWRIGVLKTSTSACRASSRGRQRGVAGRISADDLHTHALAQEPRQPAPECALAADDADQRRYAGRAREGAHSGS
jgi:hypothetical protein